MAGQDHTIPWHGARHTIAAVAFGCLILNILSAAPAWAGYLVDLPDGQTVSTRGYWIQGDMLYFAEDRDPVNVYEVQSVRQDALTEADMRDREEAMEEVRSLVAGLLGREEAALKGQADLMAGITAVSYTHLRAHETPEHLVCRLLLEKKNNKNKHAS